VDSDKRIMTRYVTKQQTDITIREPEGTELLLGTMAKALLKSKRHQLAIVNKIMGLYSQKHNQSVTVDMHCLMMMMIILIILSPLTHFSFHIHFSPFAVSVHTL
jgi:hypothetical protein